MATAARPRFAKSYVAHVALTILTLFPGLINTSAIALAAPVIGRDLHTAADIAASLPLISDAALAFGCLLAAELVRRVDGRTLYYWLLGASLLTSLTSAVTPSFSLLLAAHVLHGLVAGMLFIVTLPPLLTTFGSAKLGATASVLVPALFGAATLGPLAGGLVAAPELWRLLFGAEVLVTLVLFALAPLVLEARPPQGSHEPVDWFALGMSGAGSALVYLGVGALAGNDWRDPFASVPVAAGVLVYALLLIGEAREHHPLVPVRKLATSLALIGTIATVIGSASFAALTQCFALTLLRVENLTPRATGFAFWPEFLTAVASGYLFGKLVTTKYVVICGAAGLAAIALAATSARVLVTVTPPDVAWLCAVAGFGAGLSVSPGLFLVALSFERALVGRAIALLNLFRLTGGFVSSPGVEHTIGSRATAHLRILDPAVPQAVAEPMMRAFITGRTLPYGEPRPALQHALALGIADAYPIVIALSLGGVAAIATLLIAAHVTLRAPDLKRFDEGRPALDAPR